MLSRKCAIDKVQGLNLEEGVVNFGLQKQRTFHRSTATASTNGIEKYSENFRTFFSDSDNKFLRFA